MTIGLGILAENSNAVVLASDTQVGVTDYMKTSEGKIAYCSVVNAGSVTEEYNGTVAVTGAGGTQHILHLQNGIKDDFNKPFYTSDPTLNPSSRFEQAVSNRIKQFHTDHILPLANANSLGPWVLVAHWHHEQHYRPARLWRSDGSLLTERSPYATVGAGEMYANIILNKLLYTMGRMSIRTAVLLATFVIHRVKDRIDGCGKATQIVCIGRHTTQLPYKRINELEDLFDEYWGFEANLLDHIFGGVRQPTRRDLSNQLRRFVSKLNALPLFQLPLFKDGN